MGNLIGAEISKPILEQIDSRQKLQGAGYNSESVNRDPSVLNYLNNRNAWIKMASGVAISGSIGTEKLQGIFAQAPDQTTTSTDINNLKGTGLAKNLVLFNTIQSINDYDTNLPQPYLPRSGVRKDNLLSNSIDKMYGGLGGNSQGLQPVGGITDFTVESLNRGSIRKASVNIKVYNKFQFNLVELIYLRLGYIMMLEWGWDKYVSKVEKIKDSPNTPPNVTIEQMGPTIIEKSWFKENTFTQQSMLKKINDLRKTTQGNYDGFFGKVSNFSWKVNKDGSYDIKVDLITLGSVIESINVKKPAADITTASIPYIQEELADKFDVDKNDDGSYDNSLINNIGSNVISQWLGQTLLNFPSTDNYFNLDISALKNQYRGGVPQTQRYFIRLGDFLENLQEKIFKDITNGTTSKFKQVTIDTGAETNRCNYVFNLIPLDPGICIFDFKFTKDFADASSFQKPFTEDLQQAGTYKGIRPFVVWDSTNNVTYGKLMNIYMNITFLQAELDSNLDDKGNLSLFQYLQGICKGINKCTGGTTNIEPAVKDDNIIYLLEQNPIKGLDKLTSIQDTAPIEILGYSSKGESNFVKDFSFNTKITPDLMSMISIGATANGDAASLPFNKWNEGFKNRFEEKSEEPENDPSLNEYVGSKDSPEAGVSSPSEIITLFKQDMSTKGVNRSTIDQDGFVSLGTLNYDWEWQNTNINDLGWDDDSYKDKLTGDWEVDALNKDLLDEVVSKVQAIQKSDKLKFPDRKIIDPTLVDGESVLKNLNIVPGEEYKSYIISAFGGDTGLSSRGGQKVTIYARNALWYKSIEDSGFINRGINSFKTYINNINVAEFKESGVQSSLSGFIPVELDLTTEGLSGMKIYNKISINQRFLPPAYPKALKFVIRGINHSIKGNLWETNIKTISTSITDQPITSTPSPFKVRDTPLDNQGPIEEKGPIPPTNPNEKLKIYDQRTVAGVPFDSRTYKTYQGIDWLVGEMNIHTQDTWRKFLNILNDKYPGYTLKINATYRTYQRSIQLKAQNSKNATPGKSPHNYAYGIDMNVKDPSGKVYLKKDRTPWIESGIPQIAVGLGMRWGGYFKNYVDCVHFDVTRVTDAAEANAYKENKGLPKSQWNTKNTNYV